MSDATPDLPDALPFPESVDSNATSPRRAGIRLWLIAGGILVTAWLLTGVFVVGADEAAVIRVCGSVQRSDSGAVRLISSGLHYHLPWPLTQIDSVNVNEMRTLSVGSSGIDDLDDGEFLKAVNTEQSSRFLSGDRNILNVQIAVSFRVSRSFADRWLYGSQNPARRLKLAAGSILADVVMRSGVDFVHTLGHAAIRREVLDRLRQPETADALGVEIEDVTIAGVSPPVRVKSEFVDVMNARTERVTYINRAMAYAAQREADAEAARRKLLDQAEVYRRRTLDSAEAQAESFNRIIDQLMVSSDSDPEAYRRARQLALRRQWLETVEGVYRNVAGKVFLDSGQPVDITILRNPSAE